jgi:hypothetical protein
VYVNVDNKGLLLLVTTALLGCSGSVATTESDVANVTKASQPQLVWDDDIFTQPLPKNVGGPAVGKPIQLVYPAARMTKLHPECASTPIHVGVQFNNDPDDVNTDLGQVSGPGAHVLKFTAPKEASLASFWFFCTPKGSDKTFFDNSNQAGFHNYPVQVAGGPGFFFIAKISAAFQNPVSVYLRDGAEQEGTGGDFSEDKEFKFVYRDNANFFQGAASINGFAHPHGHLAHKSSGDTPATFAPIDRFAMDRIDNGVYAGSYHISIGGTVGDSGEVLDETDVGFFLDGVNRDTNFESFYKFND